MLLQEGRMALNDAEHAAVNDLSAAFGGVQSLTRSLPGETGNLLVHIGDDIYEVDEYGNMGKQSG